MGCQISPSRNNFQSFTTVLQALSGPPRTMNSISSRWTSLLSSVKSGCSAGQRRSQIASTRIKRLSAQENRTSTRRSGFYSQTISTQLSSRIRHTMRTKCLQISPARHSLVIQCESVLTMSLLKIWLRLLAGNSSQTCSSMRIQSQESMMRAYGHTKKPPTPSSGRQCLARTPLAT